MKPEDVNIVQSIVKDVQATLDDSSAQMVDIPYSHDSDIQFQHLESDNGGIEYDASSTQRSLSTGSCLSEANSDHSSSSNHIIRSHTSSGEQLPSEHHSINLNPADLSTVQSRQGKHVFCIHKHC